jgi:hypothetical protein
VLVDLHDWSITLHPWLDASDASLERVDTSVHEEEVCFATPTVELKPYASEYEGFMGNWGNTMDRWYRRAAVVVWPRERSFPVRAQASPAWALDTLRKRIRSGALSEAQVLARALAPFWRAVAAGEERRKLFGRALRVAEELRDPELAAALLDPFEVELLTPKQAPAFGALVRRYEEPWVDDLLSRWSAPDRRGGGRGAVDPLAWVAGVQTLCEALMEGDEEVGVSAACLVLRDRLEWLSREIESAQATQRRSARDESLERLAKPILGLLEGAAVAGDHDVRDEAVAFLCSESEGSESLLPCLITLLRTAGKRTVLQAGSRLGLDRVREHCTRSLERRLSVPARAAGDWSIDMPAGCTCTLCETLSAFLARADEQRLEWPLAKERRRHVHERIDRFELPIRHETRRTGSPHTLILTKTKALFERETAERRAWQADLDWLGRLEA